VPGTTQQFFWEGVEWGLMLGIKHLPNIFEALGSISRTYKNQNNKTNKKPSTYCNVNNREMMQEYKVTFCIFFETSL
jgi:hypothetical protein